MAGTTIQLPTLAQVTVQLTPYRLALRSAFGTSHSSTTSRQNALIAVKLSLDKHTFVGYGEVGLPPKKPGCYEADYDDVSQFVQAFTEELKEHNSQSYDPFEAFATKDKSSYRFFGALAPASDERRRKSPLQANREDGKTQEVAAADESLRILFGCLDHCSHVATRPSYRASGCGVEMALLDLWGKVKRLPMSSLIGLPSAKDRKEPLISFYTAGLDELDKMVESAAFGLKYTPYLKIKLDADVDKGALILKRLHQFYQDQGVKDYKWSIDANSAWTPAIAMRYLDVIKPYKSHVYMVEQPFPLLRSSYILHSPSYACYKLKKSADDATSLEADAESNGAVCQILSDGQIQLIQTTKTPSSAAAENKSDANDAWSGWKAVKAAYEEQGLWIYGDESITSSEDVEALREIMHGINVKLEKAGGIRGALKAIEKARSLDQRVWIGIMVSSVLNCNAAAQLLPLATGHYGDVDGVLLVTEETQWFRGGFQWGAAGAIEFPTDSSSHGLGLALKTKEAVGVL